MPHLALAQNAGGDITFQLNDDRRVSLNIYDAQGQVIRELMHATDLTAGSHTVTWDGKDQDGVDMPQGIYTWKALATKGLQANYVLSVGNTLPYGSSLMDVSPGAEVGPYAIAASSSHVLIAANLTSGSEPAMLRMPKTGASRDWSALEPEAGMGAKALALEGQTTYLLAQNDKVWRYNQQTGQKIDFINVAWDGVIVNNHDDPKHVYDMDVNHEFVVVSYPTYNAIRWYDILTGQQFKEITGINNPYGITIDGNGNVYVVNGQNLIEVQSGSSTPTAIVNGLDEGHVLAFDPSDNTLLVGEHGTTQQITRYKPDGTLLSTYGQAGGRTFGLYNQNEKESFYLITDIAPDGSGGFFVAEPHGGLRRISYFNAQGGLNTEWMGGTAQGRSFCFDPEDESIVYYEGSNGMIVRANINYGAKAWGVHAVMPYEGLAGGLFGKSGPETSFYVRKVNGNTYFMFDDGLGKVLMLDENNWSLKPVFAMSRVDELPAPFDSWAGASDWTAYWTDANGDYTPQNSEFQYFSANDFDGYAARPDFDDSMNIYFYHPNDNAIRKIAFQGLNGVSAPQYAPLPKGGKVADQPSYWSSTNYDANWSWHMVIDDQEGWIYAATNHEVNGWGSVNDAYLNKYDLNGNLLWKVGEKGTDEGQIDIGFRQPIGLVFGCPAYTDFNNRNKTFVWDSVGLWVGNFMENPNNGVAPFSHLYQMSADPKQGDVFSNNPNGSAFFLAGFETEGRLYEINGFDDFIRMNGEVGDTVATPAPTPVTWVRIEANWVNQVAEIEWETGPETHTASLVLQRSLDGTNFTDLSTVTPTGSPTQGAVYTYNDNGAAALNQILFYRVKETMTDGQDNYSPVAQLNPQAAPVTPVTWVNIQVNWFNQLGRLEWETGPETHSTDFVVERSLDGTNFSALGNVAPTGSATAGSIYQYDDAGAAALNQTLYYRVREIMTDGQSNYSSVVQLAPLAAPSTPVTWIQIDAKWVGQVAEISWETGPELSTDKFVVECSANGNTYIELSDIAPLGNANAGASYVYNDLGAYALNTLLYYRIKEIMDDGNINYSPVTQLDPPGPVPVDWVNIDAQWDNQDVVIEWTTGPETHSDEYILERSVDGVLFQAIGSYTPQGSPTAGAAYEHIDTDAYNLNQPALWYRVREIMTDGQPAFSPVVQVGPRPSGQTEADFLTVHARWRDSIAVVKWETGTQPFSDKFVVERSFDGTNFQEIGEKNARGGTNGRRYRFRDSTAISFNAPTIWYRIKEVMDNGQISYSPVVTLGPAPIVNIHINIYPNPSTSFVNIEIKNDTDQDIRFRIMDSCGRRMARGRLSAFTTQTFTIQVDNWAPGLYVFQVNRHGFTADYIVVQ
ncbi:MAG: FlgD immunoglobulin-like domain containing protein [Bacteroidota bacterium]